MDTIIEKPTITEFGIHEKKKLVNMIGELSKLEHIEIFKIIKNDTKYFTENVNGIFININILQSETIDKINTFVKYSIKKKEELRIKEEDLQKKRHEIYGENDKEYNHSNNCLIMNDMCKNIKNIATDEQKTNILKYDNLQISSEDDESQNKTDKITLKKKKIKYSGVKAKLMKNSKDNNTCKLDIKPKKNNMSLKDLENKILTMDILSQDLLSKDFTINDTKKKMK